MTIFRILLTGALLFGPPASAVHIHEADWFCECVKHDVQSVTSKASFREDMDYLRYLEPQYEFHSIPEITQRCARDYLAHDVKLDAVVLDNADFLSKLGISLLVNCHVLEHEESDKVMW